MDGARAELRNIRQGQSENVRTYSTRFEALLAKLPSFDRDWAKTQFVWGLHQRIAELVTIAEPGDLHAAINQAEKIKMARNFAASGQQGPRQGNLNRGRGGFIRGRGRFNAVTVSSSSMDNVSGQSNVNAGMQFGNANSMQGSGSRPYGRNQCRKCRGWGHWENECPSPYAVGQNRGRGQMRGRCGRGTRRGCRGAGRGNGPSNVTAALQVSDASVPGSSMQPGLGAAPVPN